MSLYLNTDNFFWLIKQCIILSISNLLLYLKRRFFFSNFKNLPIFKMVHAICPDVLVLGDGSYLIQIHTFIPFSVIHFILRHVMIITEVLTKQFYCLHVVI